jgi:YD repeat-containing protein
MFWVLYIFQAFALEPYFGPRGLLWLGINPEDESYNPQLPTFLVNPQDGLPYFYQSGFDGTLIKEKEWKFPDCEDCKFSIINDRLLSSTDERGNMYRYSYDENENLTHVQLPNSSTFIINYDTEGRVRRVQFGATEQSYQYQSSEDIHKLQVYSAGRLQYTVSEESTSPQTASVSDNTTDRVTSKPSLIRRIAIENPLGHRTQSFYDEQKRLIKFINPLGMVYLFDHQNNDSTHTIKSTLPSGKTFFVHVDRGRISSIAYPNGLKKSFAYDPFGNITIMENEYGERKKISYYNGKISAIDETPRNIYIQQTENGEVFTDSLGFILRVDRDEQGRINKLVDPVGGNITFSYGINSMTITNRNGVSMEVFYDKLKQISSIKSKDFQFGVSRMQNGQIQAFSFLDRNYVLRWNPQNQLTQITMPDGTSTKFIRNLAGDLTSIQYGSGRESYYYNANGQMISLLNDEQKSKFSYDVDGKLTKSNDWQLKYTLNNNLQKVSTNNGKISFHFTRGRLSTYGTENSKTLVQRDGYHNPTQIIVGSNRYMYEYNHRGFLLSEKRLNDQRELYKIAYEYNLCFWPIAYKYKNKIWRMTYDSGGFQLSKGLPNKSKVGYIRDSWGRIKTLRYPSGRMMEILRSNGQVTEKHKNIDATPFMETTYTFSVADIWNSFDVGDGNYFVRRNNLGQIISIDNGDLLLYARGGPSTYDSKMGMVITDETGRHVGLQTFTGVELWDLPSGYFTYTWNDNVLKEMYSGTEVGKLFYNDLNYLSSYCRDWRCWKFSYTPYGDLLDVFYLEKEYDTLIRAQDDIISRSGLEVLQTKLGITVSSVYQKESTDSNTDLQKQNREIGYSLRQIPVWYSEEESIRLVDSGFFGYPYNQSLAEWTLFNMPISFPSGPVLSKGVITSPIAGSLLQKDTLFVPNGTLNLIQNPINMIALTEELLIPKMKGLSFKTPMIKPELELLISQQDVVDIPLDNDSSLIHLYATAIIQGESDPSIEETLYALLQNDIRSIKRNVPVNWVWPWWMNEQKSHYLLAELPKIE